MGSTTHIRVYHSDSDRIEEAREKGETTADAVSRLLDQTEAEAQQENRAITGAE